MKHLSISDNQPHHSVESKETDHGEYQQVPEDMPNRSLKAIRPAAATSTDNWACSRMSPSSNLDQISIFAASPRFI